MATESFTGTVESEWSRLPPDIIYLISKTLSDITDFICFRAVCKSWCSFSAPLSDPPQQLPWLLESGELEHCCNRGEFVLGKKLRFYSLATGEIGTIHINPCHQGNYFVGPGFRYLPLIKSCCPRKLSLMLNPLTNKVTVLPPLSCSTPWPVWTRNDSMSSGEVVIVNRNLRMPFSNGSSWCYYHPDNKEWISVNGDFGNSCYLEGMIFTTFASKTTKVYAISSKKLLYNIPPPNCESSNDNIDIPKRSFLVESLGVVLRVVWYFPRSHKRGIMKSYFHIYQLEIDEKWQYTWVRTSNIGDRILFLGVMNGFSMAARPAVGLEGNCIYFTTINREIPYKYDINTGDVKRVPCPFKACTWFVPTLD